MAIRSRKRAAKPVQKKPVKKVAAKKPSLKQAKGKTTRALVVFQIDLSAFPPESVTSSERSLCVACVWQTFTRHLGVAPKTALTEIKRYTPSVEELTAAEAARPFFTPHAATNAKD